MDIVIANKQLSDRVQIGTKGTIVMIYDVPRLAYEVEFFDANNQSIELLTVERADVSRV